MVDVHVRRVVSPQYLAFAADPPPEPPAMTAVFSRGNGEALAGARLGKRSAGGSGGDAA
jgi:hypothetical protein